MTAQQVPATASAAALRVGLALSWLSIDQLWAAYLAVGGAMGRDELQQALAGEAHLVDREHDLVALALNDALLEVGMHFPVAYAAELGG